MALVIKDRIKETSTSTGTGSITLAGASTGFNSFSEIGDGNTTYYVITDGTDWEVGIGTYSSSGPTLSRDTILASSNNDAAVNFNENIKDVFCTYPADKAVFKNADGVITDATIAYDNTTSGLTATNVQAAIDEVEGRVDDLEAQAPTGQFSWDNSSTTTPAAKPVVTPSSDLLQSIHGRMRGCLLLDNGQVNYYLKATDWTQKEDGSASVLTGADGMVMVEIPKFYVKNESSGTLWKPVISATPLAGYDVHPAFIKDGVEVPYRYCSAYDACVFRPSTSTYFSGTNLDNNSANVNTASDQLASVSGVYPMVGLTRNEFRLLAANRGTGWRVGDFTLWSAIGLLMAVEAQTLNGQAVYGAGNTGGSYLGSSSNQNDSPHTIAGAGNALGNGSTDTTSGAAVNAKPGTSYMKYRGIENFWGNCWNWTDGINIFSEGNTAGNKVFAYWSNNRANFADNTAANYGLLGEIANTLATTRYGTQFSQDNVWALVTTGFSTTSTHGTSDFYFTNSGWRVLLVGGGADNGGVAGAFAFGGDGGSSVRVRGIGARLAY